MADIDIRRAHSLGLAPARAAAERMMSRLEQQFGLCGDWQGNVLRFSRPGVEGCLSLTPVDLRIEVSLGLFLKALRVPIEGAVVRELDQLFAKSRETKPAPPVKVAKAKKAPGKKKKGG